MILVSATSGVRRITLLMKVIFSVVRNTTNSGVFGGLEEMSDQTIEITPYSVAFCYVEYKMK